MSENKTFQNTLSTNSSQTTLVGNEEPFSKVLAQEVFELRGADSPNIYKDLLVKENKLDSSVPTVALTTKKEGQKETIVIPILRGPDSPLTYARYYTSV